MGSGHEPNTIGHDPDDTPTPGNISFRFAHDVRFVNDRFRHLGAVGLSLGTGSRHTLVRGNTFADVGSSAIQLSGIAAVDHNPQNSAQTSVGNTINSLVAGNTIREFLGLLWDGGAIYTTGFQGSSPENGLRIEGNTAYDKRPKAGGNTFYTDGGSRYITVRGNTSYDNPIGTTDLGPPPRNGDPCPTRRRPATATARLTAPTSAAASPTATSCMPATPGSNRRCRPRCS